MSDASITMLESPDGPVAANRPAVVAEDIDNRVVDLTSDGIHVRRASSKDPTRPIAKDNLNFLNSHLSKDHATIAIRDGKVLVKDNCSTFGTTINDNFIIPDHWFELKNEDVLGFIVSKPSEFVHDIHQKFATNENHLISLSNFANAALGLQFKVNVNEFTLSLVKILNGHKYFKAATETPEVTDANGAFESDMEEVRKEHKERLLEVQDQLRSVHKAKQEEWEQKCKQLSTACDMFDRYQSILGVKTDDVLSSLVPEDNLDASEDEGYLESSRVEDDNCCLEESDDDIEEYPLNDYECSRVVIPDVELPPYYKDFAEETEDEDYFESSRMEDDDCYLDESDDDVEEYPLSDHGWRRVVIPDVELPPYYKDVAEEGEESDDEYQVASEQSDVDSSELEFSSDIEIECCGVKRIPMVIDGYYRPYKPLCVLDVESVPDQEDAETNSVWVLELEDASTDSVSEGSDEHIWGQEYLESGSESESESDYETESRPLLNCGILAGSEIELEGNDLFAADCCGTCSSHFPEDISSDSESVVLNRKRSHSDLDEEDSDTLISEQEAYEHPAKKQKVIESTKYKLLKEVGKGLLYSLGTVIALGIYGSTLDGSEL